MTSRIHRDLHRIGVVLAALALLLALFLTLQKEHSVAVLLTGAAAFLSASARAVGWIQAGFVGSDRLP